MKNKPRSYDSSQIEVTYDIKRCIHAAECTHSLSAVFDTSKRPWIQPDQSDADTIAQVVHKCPTGALHYQRKDDGPTEPVPEKNTARLITDGPVYLSGDLHLTDSVGEPANSDTRIALCRCGHSKNKPYCDNSHKDVNWKAGGSTPSNEDSDIDQAAASGKFVMQGIINGPIVCHGKIAILNEDHSISGVAEDPAFCRCGGSQKKPFCDGTHKTINFEAE